MTDSTHESAQPDFDTAAQAVIGKHLLVGVTYVDADGELLRQEQFHGEIVRASRAEGLILRLAGTGEERWVPPDLSRLEPAAPGRYRLRGTGEQVDNPDFVSTWTVRPPESGN